MRVSQLLNLEIRDRFSVDEAKLVVRLIEEAEPWWHDEADTDPHANDRILLAVLKLAQGTLQEFEVQFRDACGDFRDVLKAAGFANEDWRAVLARDGFRVPPPSIAESTSEQTEPIRMRRVSWTRLARLALFLCLVAAIALHWVGSR